MTRQDGKSRLDMLDWQAEAFSPPDPQTNAGPTSSIDIPNSRPRLNPEFVEWLMGWPIGWTSTEPIACDAAAMALWRSKLRSQLSSLCGGAD